jgi:hypothetical protein
MTEVVIPQNPLAVGPSVFVAMLDGKPQPIEAWVQSMSEETGEVLDWAYFGGRAMVSYFGPLEKRAEITDHLAESMDRLDGRVMEIIRPEVTAEDQ